MGCTTARAERPQTLAAAQESGVSLAGRVPPRMPGEPPRGLTIVAMRSEALDRPWPAAGPATRWWSLALLAVVAPTLIAAHDPPSVTFYNQALAALSAAPLPAGVRPGRATWALGAVLGLHAALATWSGSAGMLPAGLAMM